MSYSIAILRDTYEPDIQGLGYVSFVCDDQQERTAYDDIEEATNKINQLDNEVYITKNGEAGRPEYLIVTDEVATYIETGRNGDMGNYDWDSAACDCGECNECLDMMKIQDRLYIKNNSQKGTENG